LTANSRANVDPAFLRRFHAVIDFARPDAAARARLWARLLSADMPRAPELDPVEPGGAVALSGGAIENAAFYAAVRATEEGRPLNVAHAAHALWRELAKENRPVRPDQLGPLARHLPASATAEAQEEGMSPCGSSA
jgi:SpoVK/Ycf46/Vps4 family AAA+-type ATPase